MLERFTKDERAAMDRLIEEIGPGVSRARSADQMVEVLVELGWDPESAERFVAAVHGIMRRYVVSDAGRAAMGKFYRRWMMLGVVWAVAGLIIGLAGWASAMGWQEGAAAAGPTEKSIAAGRLMSVLGWGSTGVGVMTFVRGVMGIWRAR
jgi:hypothetical protein